MNIYLSDIAVSVGDNMAATFSEFRPLTEEQKQYYAKQAAAKIAVRNKLRDWLVSGERPYKGGRTITLLQKFDYEDVTTYGLVRGKHLENDVWEAILAYIGDAPSELDYDKRDEWEIEEVRNICAELGFQLLPFQEMR